MPKADDSTLEQELVRDRAVRLFTYLKELALLRSKPVRDLTSYAAVLWFSDVPEHKWVFSVVSSGPAESQDGVWLEVRRPSEPKKPPFPASCVPWLQEDADSNPLIEPSLKAVIAADAVPDRTRNLPPRTASQNGQEMLADHPEIMDEWRQFIDRFWRPWCDAYRQWKAANGVYLNLFSIHEQLKKLGERYELLLGLGLITWLTPQNQVIRRHLLVGDATLIFDADKAKFIVQGAPEGIRLRLETEMVDPDCLPPLETQREIEEELTTVEESPWDRDEIGKVLRSWVQSIRADGVYSDSIEPADKCSECPTVTLAPALILRQRTLRTQVQCFATIAEDIRNRGAIPSGVELLCRVPEREEDLDEDGPGETAASVEDTTLYLPLPANEEQMEIVGQIGSRRGILVQGPPGTGKSHTIANIVCHLLATNKRVLVTSQTPRALRVLKEKLPKEIDALCVVLLGNDQAARQELENSVQGINQRYSERNPEISRRRMQSIESRLYEVQKSIADKSRLLRELREIETYKHEVADGVYSGTAQNIAVRVRDEEARFAWIRDDIGDEAVCPLSGTQFLELVQLHRVLCSEYCSELRRPVVGQRDMMPIEDLLKAVDEEKKAQDSLTARGSRSRSRRFHVVSQLPNDRITPLKASISTLYAAVDGVKQRFPWIPLAVQDILSDNDTPWKQLRDFMKMNLAGLRDSAMAVQSVDVHLPDHANRNTLLSDARDRLDHLKKGKRVGLGVIAPKVVKRTNYLAKQVRVNGRDCVSQKDLALLVTYLDCHDRVERTWAAWKGRDERDEGSLIVQVGYLEERLEALAAVIALEGPLNAAKAEVKATEGLAEPQWHKLEELEEMILDIETAEDQVLYSRIRREVDDMANKVRAVTTKPTSHSVNQELLSALEKRDAGAFAACYDKVGAIEADRSRLDRRASLQGSLATVAPILAEELESTSSDEVWIQRAKEWESAWSWRQAHQWLSKFSRDHDRTQLEAEYLRLQTEMQKTVVGLAAEKAWENCLQNLTEHHRTNLIAWATTMKRIGKGTGKRAPMLRRQAQSYMDNCKQAIPAWIMPLHRVFETVRPEPDAFDVAIIDEASQTGPEGMIIQYLAKQCIVVGDAEQISPEAVGTDQTAVDSLIKRHLADIPFKDLYSPEVSFFHHAAMRFAGRVVLREHFRCMPEIIQFSNDLCYQATPLKPLRQYPPDRLEPIIVRHVTNGFREGSPGRTVNRPEADALVDCLLQFCSQRQYRGKTMGVISLLGEEQARAIEGQLLTRMSPSELQERRIVCGDAYAFQGDERDIIFLSMVSAPNERIGALVKESDKRRFNVAASRARDQVVLFHSATSSDLNPECMRHKLLEYYYNPVRPPRDVDWTRCESQFEVAVGQAIAGRGYRVIPQYSVAGYRIDLVVEGSMSQLAVECDGDEWHGVEMYERDVARQRILERCGWRFWRIRGCEYYLDPIGSLQPLWETLSRMGIPPVGSAREMDESHPADAKARRIATAPPSPPFGPATPSTQTPGPQDAKGQAPAAERASESPNTFAKTRPSRPGSQDMEEAPQSGTLLHSESNPVICAVTDGTLSLPLSWIDLNGHPSRARFKFRGHTLIISTEDDSSDWRGIRYTGATATVSLPKGWFAKAKRVSVLQTGKNLEVIRLE